MSKLSLATARAISLHRGHSFDPLHSGQYWHLQDNTLHNWYGLRHFLH